MNAKQKAKWAKLRAGGRKRFIIHQGILRIGGLYAILNLIGNYFFKYGFTGSHISGYLWSVETIFKFIFNWFFFGFFMSLFFWHMGEREFRKPEKDKT